MSKVVRAYIRPMPKLVIPNENKLYVRWKNVRYAFENKKLRWWEKCLSIFVVHKELVHPVDFRIFHCRSIRGKVFSIGRVVNGNYRVCKSFEELEKLEAGRYIR